MTHAIQFSRLGGPEVLEYVEVTDATPGPGEVLVESVGAGVNFIDTYRRSGVYDIPLPSVAGSEGAGRVIALGDGVYDLAIGDRIAWVDAPGSYAEHVIVPAAKAIPVPDGVSDEVAAGFGLQGLTAEYLARSTYPAGQGTIALVHAGAGGVGLLLTQLLVHQGATVITTVGSAEKADLSRQAGSSLVLRYDEEVDIAAAAREFSGGEGVGVVYDGVGKSTFDASLRSLAVRGMLVLFGASSGQVPPFDIQRLNAGGSLFLTRPTLGHYTRTRAELLERAAHVLGGVRDGWLSVRIGATFPLRDAAEAHRALESRATTGKVMLVP
jgi:NADPH:quinone reductase and related Zn-dependent oxidoreductases